MGRSRQVRAGEMTLALCGWPGGPALAQDDAKAEEASPAAVEYAPPPSIDPSLVPDADGFIFEDVAPGVRRLVTDGAGHFPSATYIREARDMDELAVDVEGRVFVWSTTHGVDNDPAGDSQLWILGEEGVLDARSDDLDAAARVAVEATELLLLLDAAHTDGVGALDDLGLGAALGQGLAHLEGHQPGEVVAGAQPVLSIGGTSRLELEVLLPASLASRVALGTLTEVRAPQLPGMSWPGEVVEVSRIGDSATGLFPAVVEVLADAGAAGLAG